MQTTNELVADESVCEKNVGLLSELQPQALWKHFGTLCRIPRPSKGEKDLADHIFQMAMAKGYAAISDPLHNVLVTVPATAGYEHLPSLCIQSHTDMVCEKEGRADYFPIELVLKEDVLTADRTTLGADNGIGVAAMMALMTDHNLKHGPLELLFTTQEEIGLVGAQKFDYSTIKSKRFLNLDSEEEGVLFVGCAGAGRIEGIFPKRTVDPVEGSVKYCIKVSGFPGGHSGAEIHHGHGNAIVVMARILSGLEKGCDIALVEIQGGTAMNAIPISAEATIMVPADNAGKFQKQLSGMFDIMRHRYGSVTFQDQKLQIDGTEQVLEQELTQKLLEAITGIKTGVFSMEPEDPSETRTSNNIGLVKTTDKAITVTTMYRSSLSSELRSLKGQFTALLTKAGATIETGSEYAPWEPQHHTSLLRIVKKKAEEAFSEKVQVKTIHAGLECASFYEKVPGAEIVSFGPTMGAVHTTKEWVSVSSVERFWHLLLAILVAE